MIVYLWDADGSASSARGVTDDESRARKAAAVFVLSGRASTARVEKAHFVSGIRALNPGYMRLGRGWTARLRWDGRIRWVPLSPRRNWRHRDESSQQKRNGIVTCDE